MGPMCHNVLRNNTFWKYRELAVNEICSQMNFMKDETDNTADFTFYCTKDISPSRDRAEVGTQKNSNNQRSKKTCFKISTKLILAKKYAYETTAAINYVTRKP